MLLSFPASVNEFLGNEWHEHQGLHTVAKSDNHIYDSGCQQEQFPYKPFGHAITPYFPPPGGPR